MFTTFKQRFILGIYVFLVLSIPVVSYLASQQQTVNSSAHTPATPLPSHTTITKAPPIASPSASPKKSILEELAAADAGTTELNPSASDSAATTPAVTFGPTLDLNLNFEGRPINDQAARIFLGIIDNTSTITNPKFLLSFTINVPSSGSFSGVSLAGLNPGQSYRAVIKGPTQIATSSAFLMSSGVTKLNNGSPLLLTSGDFNEDNTINASDFALIQTVYGTKPSSANWNPSYDLNKDGVVNGVDVAIVIKNFGKIGDSGAWQSTPPATGGELEASNSATLPPPPKTEPGGYWIWLPK